jgi:hypothetical protein
MAVVRNGHHYPDRTRKRISKSQNSIGNCLIGVLCRLLFCAALHPRRTATRLWQFLFSLSIAARTRSPIDRDYAGHRSFSAILRILDELLIDPMSAIVASPHSSAHEPASDRPSWNDDLPQMPDFRPCWFRARQARILNIFVITSHHFVRSVGVGRTPFDRLAIALTREPSLVAAAAHEIARRARWV